ncbi:MAG: hypothetical protein HHJ11_16950 [Phycicoccus sp.]|nr:hypothetical protein [Phycicoccus sp.]
MVGPLDLAAAVQAVALILDGQQVPVLGLDGRNTYPHESTSAVITVSVHLDSAREIDQVGDLLGLDQDRVNSDAAIYHRAGAWLPGVHVSLYGRAHLGASVAGVGS